MSMLHCYTNKELSRGDELVQCNKGGIQMRISALFGAKKNFDFFNLQIAKPWR